MFRILIISFILAGSIALLPTPQASAQSPDPALLAPGQSGRMLAPPRYTNPSPTYTSPRSGGTPPQCIRVSATNCLGVTYFARKDAADPF